MSTRRPGSGSLLISGRPGLKAPLICHLQFVIPDELGVNSVDQRMSLKEILDGLPDLTDEERARLQEELDAFSPDREHAWAQIAQERLCVLA